MEGKQWAGPTKCKRCGMRYRVEDGHSCSWTIDLMVAKELIDEAAESFIAV